MAGGGGERNDRAVPADVLDALYALPPEDFTAARTAAARAQPEARAAITSLRRPSAAAWVVNTLVRREGSTLDELLDLRSELEAAQQSRSGDALRELGAQRRALIAAVTARAVGLVDREVSSATRAEVAATLEAALADPAAADAARSGHLVRALSFAGFGGVDAVGATAAPLVTRTSAPSGGRPRARSAGAAPTGPDPEEVARLEAEALDRAGRLDDAVRAHATAAGRQRLAADSAVHAVDAVAAAEEALDALRVAVADAEADARAAEAAVTEAAGVVTAAQRAAEEARTALDDLRRGGR